MHRIDLRAHLAVAACILAGSALAPPAAAGVLACPDPDTVFSDGFETRLPVVGLAQPGPFATATVSGTTVRPGRTTPWTASYPAQPGSPRPLLLFAPGFRIPSSAYADLLAHVASWGFVAVRADPEAPLFNTSHPEMVLDLRAVLDDLLVPAALPIAVDGGRVALAGHSLGGKLAVMVAGADARVGAVYAFDPVNSAGGSTGQPNILPQGIAAQTIPFGFAGELLDGSGSFQNCAPLALNYQTFFNAAASSPAAYEWTLDGASHTDFVTNIDECGLACRFCRDGTLDTAVTHAFMRASTVAFLRTYLLEEPGLCRWLTGDEVPLPISLRQRP
jgi:pimeloyl-ACP methyl ester carboxylesterase